MRTGKDWIRKTFPNMSYDVDILWQLDPFGSSELTQLLLNDR